MPHTCARSLLHVHDHASYSGILLVFTPTITHTCCD